jgi:phosphate uptake regulator
MVLSTPRVLEEFQQKFPDFQGTYQQLAQKVYKCVNMFLETSSDLHKKGSARPTKRAAENIEEVEQRIAETLNKSIRRLTQETNLSFGTVQLILKKDLHFFSLLCVCCA